MLFVGRQLLVLSRAVQGLLRLALCETLAYRGATAERAAEAKVAAHRAAVYRTYDARVTADRAAYTGATAKRVDDASSAVFRAAYRGATARSAASPKVASD